MYKRIRSILSFVVLLVVGFVLIACQEATYTITFDTQGGSTVESITIEENGEFTLPSDPSYDGHIFEGWYLDIDGTEDFSVNSVVDSDITVYAVWTVITHTVTFDANGGTLVDSQVINQGSVATEPISSMDYNTFEGWYTDEELSTAYDFSTPIIEDITLYAKWTEDVYTLNFDVANGSEITPISGVYGTILTEPDDPTQIGHTFGGWYTDDTFTTPFDFSDVLEDDTTVYAKWTPIVYTLTFETAGGTTIQPMEVPFGETITVPADPTLDGATFSGWYTSRTFFTTYSFTTMPARNVVVYAKWDMPDEDRVTADLSNIDIPSVITDNIAISRYGEKGTNLTWTFSKPDHISTSGEVVLAPIGSGGIPLTITLRASYGSYNETIIYNVLIDEMVEATVTSSAAYDFVSLSDEYIVDSSSIELFFVDNGSVPFVDIEEFLNMVDGAIESVAEEEPTEITDENGDIWNVIKDMIVIPGSNGVVTVQANSIYTPMIYDGEGEDAVLIIDSTRETESYTYEAVFDFTENTFYAASYDFFDSLGAATSTDFGDGLVFGDTTVIEGHDISIPFNNYRMDIVEFDNNGETEYLLPLYLANQLFIGEVYYDVYFNGDAIYGVDSYQFLDGNSEIISTIRTSSKNTENIPLDLRIANYDYLVFVFDYFYGLKEDLGVSSFYDHFLEFSDKLLFGNDAVHYNNIFDLTYSLDDLHTYHIMTGYYTEPDYQIDLTNINQLGERSASYYQSSWAVDDYIEESNRQALTYTPDEKTAVIVVDEFTVDTPGNFNKQLEIVQSNYPSVENIVIDLTNNGGGNVGAVWRMFGYMTEDPFYYHSMNPTEDSIYSYEISSTYVAYDYQWYIMISPVTFSAANLMAAMAKEADIATIIGVQSSGGASSVSGKVLPTGDVIFVSSTNIIAVETEEGFESVEYGVIPDFEYPGLSRLYDYAYLQTVIETLEVE